MQLPEDFLRETRAVMGHERFERFLEAFHEEPPVSIRLNRPETLTAIASLEPVPWCPAGRYLSTRPPFTFDPLLHAGCYYVQEASSMFLDEVLRQHLPHHGAPVCFLDMCAAPGGKSTLIRSALSEDSILVSNEPVRRRAQILSENMQKWGHDNSIVTCNLPKDFRKARMQFDAILCDVPCSGEGMFRKDPATVGEWSMAGVVRCRQLQRDIIGEAWQCLRPGGLLIYSTCTYNIIENEENVCWMADSLGASMLSIDVKHEWGITGSLMPGTDLPVCRFIPGFTRGEGLFMAALRKDGHPKDDGASPARLARQLGQMNVLPAIDTGRHGGEAPAVDLDYPAAVSYLRGEAIVLPAGTGRGLQTVSFMGQPLGRVKNIGTRANNLYPKEWRIKSTHIPPTYESIFRTAE